MDVKAAHTRFVLTQLFQRGRMGSNIIAEVQRQVRFARCETYPHPVGFAAGGRAFVSFNTETDEGIAPQDRLFLAAFREFKRPTSPCVFRPNRLALLSQVEAADDSPSPGGEGRDEGGRKH